MEFFKKVLATYYGGKDYETLTAELKQDHKGVNRVSMERTVFGPRGGKQMHWSIYMTPEELHAISDALRKVGQ
jgi:hypothetical protein